MTRFFTFRENINRMFTMHLIGMPPNVFRLMSTKPREENKKRLNLVQSFFSHQEAPQVLRRASLVMQLIGGVEALTARRRTTTAHGDEPVLGALVKGAALDIVVTRLRRILGAMHLPPPLFLPIVFSSACFFAGELWRDLAAGPLCTKQQKQEPEQERKQESKQHRGYPAAAAARARTRARVRACTRGSVC